MSEKIDKYRRRWKALESERQSWIAHWQEISDYIQPRAGRFARTDRNRGEKRHGKIIDGAGTRALHILSSGMMSGMTSPARPWFRLATTDRDLMESQAVKTWLDQVAKLMRSIFSRSNTYRALHMLYEELALFGSAASIIGADAQDIIRHYPLTAGEYCLATDHRGEVRTLYREIEMSVEQVVGKFGLSNVSERVRNLYDRGQYDEWITVCHAIEPRAGRDGSKVDSKNMPFASCYFEQGCNDKVLSESGFKRFPVIAPRWAVYGPDIYGTSPAMEALGGIKQLQQQQLRKAQAIDYLVKPPLQAPSTLKGRDLDLLPGGVTYVDAIGTGQTISTLFNISPNVQHLTLDINDVRAGINSTFYVDLFMMLANDTRSNITAREIAERHEEKMLMLGPVLERLNDEMLEPKIDIVFAHIVESGQLPPPPREMMGQAFGVQFISTLHQAQQAAGMSVIDRILGVVGGMAQFSPGVLDKLDYDQIVDVYADMLGVDPSVVLADERVAIIRQEKAEAQQRMQTAANAPMMAEAAKTLSETATGEKNALTDLMSRFQGYPAQG